MSEARTFPHVRVTGGPYERGLAYGRQAADRVVRSVEAYRDVFEELAGLDVEGARRLATRFREPIAAFRPTYLEEIRGIADGAGLAFEDVLAVNVRTEVMFAARAREATVAGRPDGCSAFAVLPEASATRHTLIGQNWDWLPHCFETVVVLEVEQPDGPDFVTVVEAGLLAKTGMNSSGIGLATNALVTDVDVGEAAVPYHVLLRAILDCETLSDAYSILMERPRASSANYLIAHRDGIAVDVEAAPGDFSRMSLVFPESGILLHTNHFLALPSGLRDVSLWAMPDSPFRLERLRSALAAVPPGGLTLDAVAKMLADHANFPSGVCCHPDPRMRPADQGSTVASVLMDLDERCLWLADGHPCSTPYRRLDYAGFLSKPSPVREDVPPR